MTCLPKRRSGPATIPINCEPILIEGSVTIPPAATQRGLDAVRDLGMDSTGNLDCAPILQSYLDSDLANGGELHFPQGWYYFASTVESNQKNVKLIGDGHLANMGDAPVVFYTDQALDAILWWNGSQTNSNMNGPRIEEIQFQDRSPANNLLLCAVRLTATANMAIKVGFQNMKPQRYTQGSVTVETFSKRVTLASGQWARMTPGWIVIDGIPYEIASIESSSSLILAIEYQGESASGRPYAVNWGGIGVWLEPGTDFTQYGHSWKLNGRCGCPLFASAGATSPRYTGTSRIKVLSGYLNGEGIPDSIGCYLGPYSDTFVWNVETNSYAFHVVIANGHQHDIQHVDCENAGGPVPVTGLPLDYDSCRGMLVISSNGSDTWGNRIGGYYRQVGTAIELYGQLGRAPMYTVLSACTFRSNAQNFVNGHATDTIGADVYADSRMFREPAET